jgi:hypothetical protein
MALFQQDAGTSFCFVMRHSHSADLSDNGTIMVAARYRLEDVKGNATALIILPINQDAKLLILKLRHSRPAEKSQSVYNPKAPRFSPV